METLNEKLNRGYEQVVLNERNQRMSRIAGKTIVKIYESLIKEGTVEKIQKQAAKAVNKQHARAIDKIANPVDQLISRVDDFRADFNQTVAKLQNAKVDVPENVRSKYEELKQFFQDVKGGLEDVSDAADETDTEDVVVDETPSDEIGTEESSEDQQMPEKGLDEFDPNKTEKGTQMAPDTAASPEDVELDDIQPETPIQRPTAPDLPPPEKDQDIEQIEQIKEVKQETMRKSIQAVSLEKTKKIPDSDEVEHIIEHIDSIDGIEKYDLGVDTLEHKKIMWELSADVGNALDANTTLSPEQKVEFYKLFQKIRSKKSPKKYKEGLEKLEASSLSKKLKLGVEFDGTMEKLLKGMINSQKKNFGIDDKNKFWEIDNVIQI